MFIDSHAHLEGAKFDVDRPEVVARARAAGVEEILTVGQVGEDWKGMEASLAIAEADERIWTSVGLHPHDARHFDDAVGARMLETARHPKVVAWGECGLDFYYDNSPREQQIDAFRAQLRLAREAALPVIVHSRDAADETLDLIATELAGFERGGFPCGVFHCFSYDLAVAREAVRLGFLISFSGILTFPSAKDIREAAAALPDESLLVETDCPFLAPVPHRGKRNEPSFVVETAAELARLRGTTLEAIGLTTSDNFRRLFVDRDC